MRDYVSGQSSKDANQLEPNDRLRLSLELSRVTRQITEIMAWLMIQKAFAAGEITAMRGHSSRQVSLSSPMTMTHRQRHRNGRSRQAALARTGPD